jgi:hypothetical protein
MTNVLESIGGSIAFTILGVLILLAGFLVTDLLIPGKLRDLIWVHRNRNAAIFTASYVLGLGAIVFTSIITTYVELAEGLLSTATFGALGMLLMAGAFWVVDVFTPGRLGALLTEDDTHPAIWVSAAANVAVAAIVCASIS